MDDTWVVTYCIDRLDRICSVNDAWVAFALANGGRQLLPSHIIGRSLWGMITDLTTSQVYRELARRVRAGSGPRRFYFRCDAPGQRRLLSMRMTLQPGDQLQFETAPVRDQPRVPVQLLDPAGPRAEAFVDICSWCMRLPVANGTWLELEDAIQELHLFVQSPPPGLTHVICPDCHDSMKRAIERPEAPGSLSVVLGDLP